tara:strand:+ start:1298 stop:1906 length:609 start_codon:yes stop_codon:yes gene_type:complete
MDARLVKQLKEAIPLSYYPQYNWDLSKDIAEEDLELFKLALRECPSIDNNTYFKVHFIRNRDVIQKIYDNLWKDTVGGDVTQTQILANLLVVFEEFDNKNILQAWDWTKYVVDRGASVGMAIGYLELVCGLLGYKTGQLPLVWNEDVSERVKNSIDLDNFPLAMLGIGYGNEGVSPHRSHFNRNVRRSIRRRTPPVYIKVWE